MRTAEKNYKIKNDLWATYKAADPITRDEIIIALKKVGLFRYWLDAASKSGYDLKKAKAPLRDIFVKFLPDTAPLFGLSLQTN